MEGLTLIYVRVFRAVKQSHHLTNVSSHHPLELGQSKLKKIVSLMTNLCYTLNLKMQHLTAGKTKWPRDFAFRTFRDDVCLQYFPP